jgi:hypothetical protein
MTDIPSGAKEVTETVIARMKGVPQRLKPHCKCSTFGTAEAVPLSKTGVSAAPSIFATFTDLRPKAKALGYQPVPFKSTDLFNSYGLETQG